MKASWECQRWCVAPLSRMATFRPLALAAEKISASVTGGVLDGANAAAGRAEMTWARAAETRGRCALMTEAMLATVEARSLTTDLVGHPSEGAGVG